MTPLPLVDINGIWHIAYFIGIGAMLPVCLHYLIGVRLPLIAQALWYYILLQALFFIEWPTAHFGPYTSNFQSTAAQAFAELIFIPIGAILLHRYIKKLITPIAVFSSLCVWFQWPGFMHAPSFNMALAAMCLPAIYFQEIQVFIVLTALTHHGSTALLIFLAQVLVFFFTREKKTRKKFLPFIAGGFIGEIFSAYHFQNQPLFNSGERIHKWVEFFQFWIADWRRIIFGVGPGSFVWYSIMSHPYQTGFFMQMYSDWFQVLWENGIVGFGLEVAVAVEAVKRARKNPRLLQGLFGCMVFGLTYGPLRYFPTALLTAWFFSQALVIENVDVEFAGFIRPVK